MTFSNGMLWFIASVIVAFGTIIASYLAIQYSQRSRPVAEYEIERELRQKPIEQPDSPLSGDSELPSSVAPADYATLLGKIRSDLADGSPASVVRNEAAELLTKAYHEQALFQSGVQFWFGVLNAMIGFVYILVSGLSISSIAGVPRIVPGTIVAAVASLFLKQSSETRQRATAFYDRLQSYDRQRESVLLVAAIRETPLRGAAQTLLALHMAGAPMGDVVTVLCREIASRADAPAKERE